VNAATNLRILAPLSKLSLGMCLSYILFLYVTCFVDVLRV
jgi:hypothetical protein